MSLLCQMWGWYEPPLQKGAVSEASGGFFGGEDGALGGKLKEFSRSLRSNLTEAEQRLWYKLRGKQICNVQFYRQKPLLSFIVDFYSPRAKLVIELDGAQHLEPEHRVRDEERDALLANIGLKVLRFDDRQVLMETDAVMDVIFREVSERIR